MEMILIAIVTGLMMLGVITVGEMVIRALKPKLPEEQQPVDYTNVVEGATWGLGDGEWLSNLLHSIGHFFHH